MTANEIDWILSADVPQRGALILGAREDQWFERKSARTDAKTLARAMVAFANAEGGTIVVGVHDGAVEGIERSRNKINDLRQASIDHASPPVRCAFHEVECVNADGDQDTLLIVRVDPGERVHESASGDCFLRVGDESRKLNYLQRQELEFDKGQAQYDGLPVVDGYTVDNLDASLLEHYRSVTGAASADSILQARSLLRRDGALTNAGYLLFADHPQQAFPEAYVRVLKFLSTERGSGSRLSLDDDADFKIEGPLPVVIEKAAETIDRLAPKRRSLDDSGAFTGHHLVPREAWLEGLVNAVIHRSYSLAGDHIRVEIYPDRIEIESPGRFPGLVDPSKPLDISRFARNPRIARVCADLRIGQELGEGIKRIFEEMRRVGLTDPVYTQGTGSVKLRLAVIARLDPRVAARLPKGAQAVLDTLQAAGVPMGTGEIAAATGLSRPATIARLQALRGEKLIVWSGKSPNDPRAVWLLASM